MDLDEIKNKMEAYKLRRENAFAQLQATFDVSKQTGATSVSAFLARCNELCEIKERFEGYQDALIELNAAVEEKDRLSVDKQSIAFDQIYYEIRATESSLKHRLNPVTPSTPDARLPKIRVPNWSGEINSFHNFIALFNEVVHKGPYSDVTKLTYLRSLLSGPPLKLIETLELSNANYNVAYRLIQNRYGSSRALATHYINKIIEFKPVKNDSPQELQTFLDTFNTSYLAFNNLDINDHSDFILFQLASRALPPEFRLLFERSLDDTEKIPTFSQLTKFVEGHCKIKEFSAGTLEYTQSWSPVNKRERHSPFTPSKFHQKSTPTSLLTTPSSSKINDASSPSRLRCDLCSEPHSLYCCPKFNEMTPNVRYHTIKAKSRCFACLGAHMRVNCKSTYKCKLCGDPKHHTLLHNEELESGSSITRNTLNKDSDSGKPGTSALVTSVAGCQVGKTSNVSSSPTCITNVASSLGTFEPPTVLLGTAQALLKGRDGSWVPIRLVIDTGSQINLITTETVQKLGLPVQKFPLQLCGVTNKNVATSTGKVRCILSAASETGTPWCIEAHVLNKECADLPSSSLPPEEIRDFLDLPLADNGFYIKHEIDFLLGAELYPEILMEGSIVRHGKPAAIKTAFGWVIMGSIQRMPMQSSTTLLSCVPINDRLDDVLQRFWQTEEVEHVDCHDPNDEIAEKHFVLTHSRAPSGKYVVRLPFVESELPPFGDSKTTALRRWRNLESKLQNKDQLKTAYHQFMQEYLDRGHMQRAETNGTYFIPHFAILRDSPSSPVRVVFDASCPDTSGLSLNDRLLTGPPLQKDITDILTLFRLGKIAVTTDIKMMYRQIWLHPYDLKYQHILWRTDPESPIEEYELCTVTYGLGQSPFLAQRVLLQLVKDHGEDFPRAAQAIRESCFMDDVCVSIDHDEEAILFINELTQLLQLAGFELRKWASNSKRVLEEIPLEHQAPGLAITANDNKMHQILGLHWNPQEDAFSYKTISPKLAKTKRAILSHVASIFDPLGWISPVVFWAKCFLQDLWSQGFSWDDRLPDNVASRWAAFATQLPSLADIKIPRLCKDPSANAFHLIGMCDASSRGFAAAIYLRSASPGSTSAKVTLVKGKTKVAPLKVQTIPRLELNGALLLSKLLKSTSSLQRRLNIQSVFLFSDSQVVLSWLQTPPHKLKTYVANRVVKILEVTQFKQWHHVSSNENAADCASRGLLPSDLLSAEIWWKGPKFLRSPLESWPIHSFACLDMPSLPDLKDNVVTLATIPNRETKLDDLLIRLSSEYSSLTKLQRVVSWLQRFIHNARQPSAARRTGRLKVDELRSAMTLCIRHAQKNDFASDIQSLRNGKSVSKQLLPFTPFLDSDQLLRVGGRLSQAPLTTSAIHPLLLRSTSRLAILVCDYYHLYLLHAGPQATQAMIQRSYSIIGLRSLLRKRIHNCLICHKFRTLQHHPFMGDLPQDRVTPTRAFLHSGVDMAGPLLMKEHNRRNARISKAYICVFVCMSVKAVHIELTTDLSTACFKAAFDRFIARQGICERLYCDRGSNFVGASNEQKELIKFLKESEPEIGTYLASKAVEYQFNPPESPWMGGLWEAAVKSIKRHLFRSAGNLKLTYEELSTVLTRIEAVLNSRPLCLNAEYAETNADFLSPGHFLVGAPLVSPPENSFLDVSPNYLSRWQLVQKAVQEIWKRWSSEYLHTIIQRTKWTRHRRAPVVGEAVLLRQENSKPLDWPLGRVLKLHTSHDGIPRSADVRTATGIYTRPVAKLVPVAPETDAPTAS